MFLCLGFDICDNVHLQINAKNTQQEQKFNCSRDLSNNHNSKYMDLKKIGVAVVALIAISVGLIRNSDTTTTAENQQTGQTNEQNSNTEVVDFKLNNEETTVEKDNLTPRNDEDKSNPGNQRITYEGKNVILTRHAKCRMDCRKISNAEVQEVIDEGKENKRKSNPNDPRCPTIALEDWTEDGQLVRIIVADCDDVAKLVTVIDLKNDYNCVCE
jgi:hypothetical protein